MSQPLTPERRARLLHLATTASVATALLLIAAKLAAWVATGSVAVLASLVDSLMDTFASIVNLLAVRYALTPADAEHRFGHGKAESLAALGQATFIAGSAVFLGLQAVDRLLHPQPLEATGIGLTVMGFSIVATAGLLAIQRHVIRATGSAAIRADALHYATDLVTNLGTIAALLAGRFGFPGADPVLALGLAGYILYSAVGIAREAVGALMDRALPDDTQARVLELARAQSGVLGVHDLRTRQSGHTAFVQLHLELEDRLPLVEAHAIADAVERAIRTALPGAEVITHQDPSSVVDRRRATASSAGDR